MVLRVATVAQSVVRPRPGRPAVKGIQSEVAWTGEAGAQGDGVKSFFPRDYTQDVLETRETDRKWWESPSGGV